MRASILSSVTSVANEIIAIVECLDRDNLFFCALWKLLPQQSGEMPLEERDALLARWLELWI